MDPNLKSKNLTVFMENLFIFYFFGKFIVLQNYSQNTFASNYMTREFWKWGFDPSIYILNHSMLPVSMLKTNLLSLPIVPTNNFKI